MLSFRKFYLPKISRYTVIDIDYNCLGVNNTSNASQDNNCIFTVLILWLYQLTILTIAAMYHVIQTLEGENLGKTVHTKNWQIIFWRMSKIVKVTKIIHNYLLVN